VFVLQPPAPVCRQNEVDQSTMTDWSHSVLATTDCVNMFRLADKLV